MAILGRCWEVFGWSLARHGGDVRPYFFDLEKYETKDLRLLR
jgi:hypothetical protein